MTKELILHNQLKQEKNPRQLRKAGFVPGIIYGPAFRARKVAVSYHDFCRLFRQAGTSQVIYIQMDDVKEPVLIHDVQLDTLSDRFSHVDFYRFKEGSKVRAVISLEFQGIAPAVKNKGGVLFTNLREVEIEALPEKLIHSMVVDLSVLSEIGDMILLSDLAFPEGVEAVDTPDVVIVHVTEREEEQVMTTQSEEEVSEESKEDDA